MISIVLAEDHRMVRECLRHILEKQPDLHVAGEACDGNEALEKVAALRPDVLVLDLTLPRRHGLNVLAELGGGTRLKIIILSMHRDEASVFEALRLGARGYVIKDGSSSDLVDAIRAAVRDELYVSDLLRPALKRAAANSLNGSGRKNPNKLTRQEIVVLQLAASGKRSLEVANELGISVRTAEKHRSNLMRKLNLRDQSELLRYAIRQNIVPA